MSMLLSEAQRYLDRTLGVHTHAIPADIRLPFSIKDAFEFFDLSIPLRQHPSLNVLLMVEVEQAYAGIVKLDKTLTVVREATDQPVVYVCNALTAVERRSLINHQINFIQAGYQVFLPAIGMDLREHYRQRKHPDELESLTPAAQATLIERLYDGWSENERFTSNAIMGYQNYSRVTLSKVVSQLQAAGLIEPVQSENFVNTWVFKGDPSAIYNRARPYLRSPVRRRVGITGKLQLDRYVFRAGESALSRYSMLADPDIPVYGMTKPQLDAYLRLNTFSLTTHIDEIRAWVEVWTYENVNHRDNSADEASLLLSLEENPDERIQIALEELKERVDWLR